MTTTKTFCAVFGVLAVALAATAAAAFPDQPVQYIIPFAPGGGSAEHMNSARTLGLVVATKTIFRPTT
ncbi:MAG: hypothetical protein ABI777_01905 [Betaproteobacteria bacterium]